MTHTSRASPTPAHVHTGHSAGVEGAGGETLSTPANPRSSTAPPAAIQPEPAGDLSAVPARAFPPPPHPRVPPGSLHQPGPWLPQPVLCARQGKGAQAGPEEACQCWGQEGRAVGRGRAGDCRCGHPCQRQGRTQVPPTLPWFDQARDPMAGSLVSSSVPSCSRSR